MSFLGLFLGWLGVTRASKPPPSPTYYIAVLIFRAVFRLRLETDMKRLAWLSLR